jgi:hypothetical protein
VELFASELGGNAPLATAGVGMTAFVVSDFQKAECELEEGREIKVKTPMRCMNAREIPYLLPSVTRNLSSWGALIATSS